MQAKFLTELRPGDRVQCETHYPGSVRRTPLIVQRVSVTERTILFTDGTTVQADLAVPITLMGG